MALRKPKDIFALQGKRDRTKVEKKISEWGRPIVETFRTSRGSIFKLSRDSQLPYNIKYKKCDCLVFFRIFSFRIFSPLLEATVPTPARR